MWKSISAKTMVSRKRRYRRFPHLEQLENRELFAHDAIAFAGYGSLTFSIAPDNTHVAREVSTLQSKFNEVAPTSQWQDAIARAFQKWSVHTNVNIGNVTDNGAASGVYGPTRGDERFGDIRITGFDFAKDTFAEAISENARSVGTWAGDMFFNTAVAWNNIHAIEAAALHEVGHILGLEHSGDPNSPMHAHGPSEVLELTTQDIQNVQAIHGVRELDPNEESHGNDSIARATSIKGSEDDDTVLEGFSGSQVWIQFGDLHNASDRDVFEIKTAANYNGPLSVEVRTQGLSLAQLGTELTDRNGTILAQSQLSGKFGGTTVLTLNATSPDGKYYLHVHSGLDNFWASGDYSVTIASSSRLQLDADAIAQWSRKAHRWYYDSDRTKDGFSYHLIPSSGEGPESDDKHTDDTFGASADVPLVLSTASRTVYQTVGTVSDLVDIDHFRVVAPKVFLGRMDLVLDVESLLVGGLVPDIYLLDDQGRPLNSEVRVQGYGQTQLVLENVQPDQTFYIQLKASSVSSEHKTGSFALVATFAEPSPKPELLVSGNVNTMEDTVEREWYIARPQLFGFSLKGSVATPLSDGQVWVSIFDDQRRLVTGLVAPWNSLRSAPGIFLNPGLYYFQIAAASNNSIPTDVSFQLMAETPSRPVGPLLGGTKVQPMYLCPGSTTEYCYPGSTTPTGTPQKVGPQPTIALPVPATKTVVPSPSAWFWGNDFLPTNPSLALDVSGNGLVDPLDALSVINALNSMGVGPVPTPPNFLGHLDTNSNGLVDPLDALLVINYLNTNSR